MQRSSDLGYRCSGRFTVSHAVQKSMHRHHVHHAVKKVSRKENVETFLHSPTHFMLMHVVLV